MEEKKLDLSSLCEVIDSYRQTMPDQTYKEIMDHMKLMYEQNNGSYTTDYREMYHSLVRSSENLAADRVIKRNNKETYEWLDSNQLLHRDHDKPARIEYVIGNGRFVTERHEWFEDGVKHRAYDLPAEMVYNDGGKLMCAKWWRYDDLSRGPPNRPFIVKYCTCGDPEIEFYEKGGSVHEIFYDDIFRDENTINAGDHNHILTTKTIHKLNDINPLHYHFTDDITFWGSVGRTVYNYVFLGDRVVVESIDIFKGSRQIDCINVFELSCIVENIEDCGFPSIFTNCYEES